MKSRGEEQDKKKEDELATISQKNQYWTYRKKRFSSHWRIIAKSPDVSKKYLRENLGGSKKVRNGRGHMHSRGGGGKAQSEAHRI